MKELMLCDKCDKPLADMMCVNPLCERFATFVRQPMFGACMIGALLKRQREEKGLSQRGLAAKIKRSASWLSKVERGLEHPGPTVLVEIASELGLDRAHTLWLAGEPVPWMARLLKERACE